jgi:hypothetical protein
MKRSIFFVVTVCSLVVLSLLLPVAQSFTVDYSSLIIKTQSHNLKPAELSQLKAADRGDEIGTISDSGRRHAFLSVMAAGVSLATVSFGSSSSIAMNANALDMDAFINRELDSDTKNCDPKKDPKCMPKLSADDALCQYGQVGAAKKMEACQRIKAAGGKLPDPAASQGKSLGGAYAM